MGFGKTENVCDGYQNKNIIMNLKNFYKAKWMATRRYEKSNFLALVTERNFFKIL